MTYACDHCGSPRVTVIDRPDHIHIQCLACNAVDFIWKEEIHDIEQSDLTPDEDERHTETRW